MARSGNPERTRHSRRWIWPFAQIEETEALHRLPTLISRLRSGRLSWALDVIEELRRWLDTGDKQMGRARVHATSRS